MCAANQDSMEVVKETDKTNGLIGVLGEVDSHQVRIRLNFSTCSYPSFHFILPFLEVRFGIYTILGS